MPRAVPHASDRSPRPRKLAVALGIGLALALVLAGCGGDDPAANPTATKTTSKTKTSEPIPTDSATVVTATPELMADCLAVQDLLNSVTDDYPDGPSLTAGREPSEDNVAALTAIRDGLAAIDFQTDSVGDAAATATTVIDKILDAPHALLTARVVKRFNNAGNGLSSACVVAAAEWQKSNTPTTTPTDAPTDTETPASPSSTETTTTTE
jgi:hypothetical protein